MRKRRSLAMNLDAVAQKAGVSTSTVSRVLNNRPDVSPETREAVGRVLRDQNYTTNRNARALSAGRTGLIGFTIPYVYGDYFTSILAGATEALYELDMRAVLCPTRQEHDREVTLLERLMNDTTDGALVLLPEESNEELRGLQAFGFPFVVIDPRLHAKTVTLAANHYSLTRWLDDNAGTPRLNRAATAADLKAAFGL